MGRIRLKRDFEAIYQRFCEWQESFGNCPKCSGRFIFYMHPLGNKRKDKAHTMQCRHCGFVAAHTSKHKLRELWQAGVGDYADLPSWLGWEPKPALVAQ